MKKSWVGIDIACDEAVAEELAAEVAEAFGVGVEVGNRFVRFYLEGNELLAEREAELRELLEYTAKIYGVRAPFRYETFPLSDEGWADSWKVHFKPLRVGKSLVIRPTWESFSLEAGDRVITMDPGRAFGTGHHETTRLCLEWMEQWAEEGALEGQSLLDVGTGSGVLAMSGALLGFTRVVGIDNDPEAIEVARENTVLNGLEGRVVLLESTVADVSDRFDVVVANIQALPLIRMAKELSGALKETGRLVLSGILVEQQEDVRKAYEDCGLDLTASRVAGEWVLLAFDKRRKGE